MWTAEQIDRLIAAVERVAESFEALVREGDPAVAAIIECPHPEAARVEFGSMGSGDEWECAIAKGGCGHHHGGQAL